MLRRKHAARVGPLRIEKKLLLGLGGIVHRLDGANRPPCSFSNFL